MSQQIMHLFTRPPQGVWYMAASMKEPSALDVGSTLKIVRLFTFFDPIFFPTKKIALINLRGGW